MQCSGMQGLYAQLTAEDIYICLVQWYSRHLCLIDRE